MLTLWHRAFNVKNPLLSLTPANVGEHWKTYFSCEVHAKYSDHFTGTTEYTQNANHPPSTGGPGNIQEPQKWTLEAPAAHSAEASSISSDPSLNFGSSKSNADF